MQRQERFYVYSGGTVILHAGDASHPWEVTYLTADAESPSYPAVRLTSDEGGPVPAGPDFQHVAEWAFAQDWGHFTEDEVPAVRVLQPEELEPLESLSELRERALEQGVLLSWVREPDGSYSWAMTATDGLPLQSGTAGTWDDARLEMIGNLYPRSDEQ